MKLPNTDAAIVAQEKIVGYLLNSRHPDGAGKAEFFESCGFRAEEWHVLAAALREMAGRFEVTKCIESIHGWKYIIDGDIDVPVGGFARVRSV
jgi:hypothetical protein